MIKTNIDMCDAPPKRTTSFSGFTLVEVLMAMLILLFGLLAVGSMQIMAMRGNQHARESTERTTTADNIMEWLMGLGFNHVNLRNENDLSDDINIHTLNIPTDGSVPTASDLTTSGDELPPDNLIPLAGNSRNNITSIQWEVFIQTPSSFAAGDEITSKRIRVTVNWEGGGTTQISNIKPSL